MPQDCVNKSAPTQANLTWSNLGPISVGTALDLIPKRAGVYKLTFKLWGNTYAYIGEAGARGLRARIAVSNHPPAEGNKVEHLLHDLLRAAGEADLSVCCTGVTLDEQKARRKFEKEATTDSTTAFSRSASVCRTTMITGTTLVGLGYGPAMAGGGFMFAVTTQVRI